MTTVAGGVYAETCIEPYWDDVYGSGGRAAAALSAMPGIRLQTYRAAPLKDALESLSAAYGIAIGGPDISDSVQFDYVHSLADPRITPRPDAIEVHPPIEVQDDVVLRFGFMEGSAKVTAQRAVYDPQSAFDPRPFSENGSHAEEVALVLNQLEARRLTGQADPESMVDFLLQRGHAQTVVLKLGGRGALVGSGPARTVVPAYRSDTVWKVGSGDVFSAAFTQFWGVEHRPAAESADLASRATSRYCNDKALPIQGSAQLSGQGWLRAKPGHGRVYIAAPFFTLPERWLVEEIRSQLIHMGVDVFSPLHDVGVGPAEHVAKLDLAGLDGCGSVLAVLSGGDPGTIFEVGYAVAKHIPVVALVQKVPPENLKMPMGSGCRIVEDLVSAIYQAIWALP